MLINFLPYFNVYLEPFILILDRLHSSDHLHVIGRSRQRMFCTKLPDQTIWVISDRLFNLISHP